MRARIVSAFFIYTSSDSFYISQNKNPAMLTPPCCIVCNAVFWWAEWAKFEM